MFRKKLIVGVVLLVLVLIALPFFFQYIQNRRGALLNDWVLNYLPAYDVSIPIFAIIWGIAGLTVFRAFRNPAMLLTLLWSYVLVTLTRMITITTVALDPPADLIELVDPISNSFYGAEFVTRDLFFSGHTSTVFLMYLCLRKRNDKALALIGTILVGIMLLVQHVHYTVDVLAAPLGTYIVYLLGKKIAGYQPNE
ncbi:phosphatase PAP2-related protein [Nibrella saemangeumensis]|uniref:phosphatase PAP2-related protein n=1 Tax=Nibrella saemangeumensis TaxID=1084526 RepID=UPI0031EEB042